MISFSYAHRVRVTCRGRSRELNFIYVYIVDFEFCWASLCLHIYSLKPPTPLHPVKIIALLLAYCAHVYGCMCMDFTQMNFKLGR